MKLKRIYESNGIKYADFDLHSDIGIEYEKDTYEVKEIHFEYCIKGDSILKKQGYERNDELKYFYNYKNKILTIPIVEIERSTNY